MIFLNKRFLDYLYEQYYEIRDNIYVLNKKAKRQKMDKFDLERILKVEELNRIDKIIEKYLQT